MSNFNKLVESLLSEMAANVAGGVQSVTGPATAGDGGGRFNVQDDRAYAPGDARVASLLGTKSSKKKRQGKGGIKVPVQRRSGIYLPGM
jgi:hypothetical protein